MCSGQLIFFLVHPQFESVSRRFSQTTIILTDACTRTYNLLVGRVQQIQTTMTWKVQQWRTNTLIRTLIRTTSSWGKNALSLWNSWSLRLYFFKCAWLRGLCFSCHLVIFLTVVGSSQKRAPPCVCYSEYLSTRDRNLFADTFSAFRVSDHIIYSKITTFSEDTVKAQGDIRKLTERLLRGKALSTPGSTINNALINVVKPLINVLAKPPPTEEILLVDEVIAHDSTCLTT